MYQRPRNIKHVEDRLSDDFSNDIPTNFDGKPSYSRWAVPSGKKTIVTALCITLCLGMFQDLAHASTVNLVDFTTFVAKPGDTMRGRVRGEGWGVRPGSYIAICAHKKGQAPCNIKTSWYNVPLPCTRHYHSLAIAAKSATDTFLAN